MFRTLTVVAVVCLCSAVSALPPKASNYVTVGYDPIGQILTLNGDAASNSLKIAASGNKLIVSAGSPTRLGNASSSVTSLSFKYNGNLTVNAAMAGGSDLVVFNGLLVRSGDFDLGAGDDVLNFVSCRLGNVSVNGGPGFDNVRLSGSTVNSFSWANVESAR